MGNTLFWTTLIRLIEATPVRLDQALPGLSFGACLNHSFLTACLIVNHVTDIGDGIFEIKSIILNRQYEILLTSYYYELVSLCFNLELD